MASSPSSSEYDLKFTTSSYYSLTGVSITLRDQSSQTEWPYKSNLGKGGYILPRHHGRVPMPEVGG